MKSIVLLLTFFSLISDLMPFLVVDGENIHEMDRVALADLRQIQVETTRHKNDKILSDLWEGPTIKDILEIWGITAYQQLKFTATDNYMIRLNETEINPGNVIIALKRNGHLLEEDEIRLIVPERRDMYWVTNIEQIEITLIQRFPVPDIIFNGVQILNGEPLSRDPAPFINAIGYDFDQLITEVMPSRKGDYLLTGRDGISHLLNYNQYLKSAVLILEDDQLTLKSPQMPAGMWIKDLVYVQKDEIAILMSHRFDSLPAAAKFLDWNDLPDSIKVVQYGEIISVPFDFTFDKERITTIEYFLINE
ncbi:MAG: molybdopterin-dependent oxidoreductase [Candidatus Cloacimonetes bacterium]|nr:molybdopterin-dependent oxidoreductase [Candidatus Cloacimonadota bacterium]